MSKEIVITEQPRAEHVSYFDCKSLTGKSISNYFSLNPVPLASGSFGSVYASVPTELARLEIGEDLPDVVAVKNINLSDLKTKKDFDKTKRFIKSEILILKTLQSEYSSKYYGCFETTREPHNLYIVMELVEGQDLFEYLVGTAPLPRLTNVDKIDIVSKIAKGIRDLHRIGLAHRDLKPENIMYDHHTGSIKIIDYGLSCLQTDTSKIGACTGAVGSPEYVDPYTIKNPLTHNDLQLSDWWSFGQIVYVLFENQPPRMTGWKHYKINYMPKEYSSILSRLLNNRLKPTERPKPDEIISVFINE